MLLGWFTNRGRKKICWMRDQGWDLGTQPQDQGSQAMGSDQQYFDGPGFRLYHFCEIRDKNFVTLLESKIRNFGPKLGSAMRIYTLL